MFAFVTKKALKHQNFKTLFKKSEKKEINNFACNFSIILIVSENGIN